jgi:hypothetical protein
MFTSSFGSGKRENHHASECLGRRMAAGAAHTGGDVEQTAATAVVGVDTRMLVTHYNPRNGGMCVSGWSFL